MNITRFIHVNIVCSDLARSLDFYVDALGATVHEMFNSGESDLRAVMGVGDAGVAQYRAALLYWGDAKGGPYVDLLEWVEARDGRKPLAAQDRGLVRLALQVSDLSEALASLASHGISPIGPVDESDVGPWRLKLALVADPDGTLIELVQFPEGQKRVRTKDRLAREELRSIPSV